MINMEVKIDGLDEIKKAFEKAPEHTVREASKAVEKSILKAELNIKKEAPVNKAGYGGNLRQKIRSKMRDKLTGEVKSSAKYSEYVHEGTRPHIIRPRIKKALANKRRGQFFGKKVNHPGTKKNPFMKRGIEKSQNSINKYFQTAVNNILKVIK